MAKRVSFDEVRNNNLRSTLLILFFLVFMTALGAAIGWVWGSYVFGAIITLIAASIYALIAYIQGRRMLTKMTGARELTKKEFPHAYNAIEDLSLAAGIPTPQRYVIDTPALNAFATGRNPENAAVVLTTGLIKHLNREELEGVIAHEIAHIKNYDIRVMMIGAVITGIILFLSQFLLRSFFFGGGRRNDGKAGVIMLVVAIVLAILSPIISEMIKLAISRKREYSADAGAATITRYPQGLANALRKISADPKPEEKIANSALNHMYISNPDRKKAGFWSKAFSTHPPTEERIKRLEQM